jgi:hypothetical protein
MSARITRSILAALLCGGLITTQAQASTPDLEFHWAFRCDGLGAFFEVDAQTVRAEGNIPPEFGLLGEDGGKATLFLAAFDCDPAVVDGQSAPFLYALATVQLDPTDPSGRPGSYDFFKFTEDARVHSRFERMGVWVRQLPEMSVDVSRALDVPFHGEAHIPWKTSPFTLTADGVPGIPVPDKSPSDHWSAGHHGFVYGADQNCQGRGDPAALTVETVPGTTMARILGRSKMTVPGIFLRLSAAGHVALEGQTRRPEECPTWG